MCVPFHLLVSFDPRLTSSLPVADCQYSVGDQFFEPLGLSFSERGRDLGIFLAYSVFNCFLTVVGATFLTKVYNKR